MRKAKKKVHPMPKLGFLDKLLYWTGMILTGGGGIVVFFLHYSLRADIAFQDSAVIASRALGELHAIWLLCWLISACCIITVPYRKRIPVFGRKDIKYGPPAYPRIFPLLMKDKPQYWESPKRIAFRRKAYLYGSIAAAVLLLFCLMLYSDALYPRVDIHNNGNLLVYDGDNQLQETYRYGDVESVTISVVRHNRRRSLNDSWHVYFSFTIKNGTVYRFPESSFQGDWRQSLQTMLYLKEHYDSVVTVKDEGKLDKVIAYNNLGDEEIALLYQLFDQ